MPIVLVLCVIGSFAISVRVFDIWVMLPSACSAIPCASTTTRRPDGPRRHFGRHGDVNFRGVIRTAGDPTPVLHAADLFDPGRGHPAHRPGPIRVVPQLLTAGSAGLKAAFSALAAARTRPMERIGIGIIGARFAADLHRARAQQDPRSKCDIVAVCSRTKKAQRSLPRSSTSPTCTDHRAIAGAEDIQLVTLPVVTSLHHTLAIDARTPANTSS